MNSLCAWYRTAKNVYRPAITTLLVIPRPNQTTTREASATNGVLLSVTTARYRKFSSARGSHTNSIAPSNASAEPATNPSTVSCVVIPA